MCFYTSMENNDNDDNLEEHNQFPERVLLQSITVAFVAAIYLYLYLKIIAIP
jgi:hypothetical protein